MPQNADTDELIKQIDYNLKTSNPDMDAVQMGAEPHGFGLKREFSIPRAAGTMISAAKRPSVGVARTANHQIMVCSPRGQHEYLEFGDRTASVNAIDHLNPSIIGGLDKFHSKDGRLFAQPAKAVRRSSSRFSKAPTILSRNTSNNLHATAAAADHETSLFKGTSLFPSQPVEQHGFVATNQQRFNLRKTPSRDAHNLSSLHTSPGPAAYMGPGNQSPSPDFKHGSQIARLGYEGFAQAVLGRRASKMNRKNDMAMAEAIKSQKKDSMKLQQQESNFSFSRGLSVGDGGNPEAVQQMQAAPATEVRLQMLDNWKNNKRMTKQKWQTDVLKKYFEVNPIWSNALKLRISEESQLTEQVVSKWNWDQRKKKGLPTPRLGKKRIQ